MYLLLIVGSLAVLMLGLAIFIEFNKNSGASVIPDIIAPGSNDPREIATQMVRAAYKGQFPMHILTNEAPPFNDDEYLGKYKSYIHNPSVIAFIQNVKDGYEYE
jgi:hypothetical protein